jgi:hypothetical protein
MAGPSDRACGPPKGMLGPATHDFAWIGTKSRGWQGERGVSGMCYRTTARTISTAINTRMTISSHSERLLWASSYRAV